MTNAELEEALKHTQEALLKVCETCAKMRCILVARGILDELDNSYIKCQMSEEEYVKKHEEQYSLTNLFNQMFQQDIFPDNK